LLSTDLTPSDDIGVFGKKIDQLALAFVAPLGSEDHLDLGFNVIYIILILGGNQLTILTTNRQHFGRFWLKFPLFYANIGPCCFHSTRNMLLKIILDTGRTILPIVQNIRGKVFDHVRSD
jgi:hypothetical protein